MTGSDDEFVTNTLRLRCSEAVELVTDYLDGELNRHDLIDFETHLAHCEGCTIFADQIKMTITLTRTANQAEISLLPKDFDGLLTLLRQRGEADAS